MLLLISENKDAEFEKVKTGEYIPIYSIRPSKKYYEVMKNV